MVNILEENTCHKFCAVAREDYKFSYKLPGKQSKEWNIIRHKIEIQTSCQEKHKFTNKKVILWVIIKKMPYDIIVDKSPFLPQV